jgi:hypothetical protein
VVLTVFHNIKALNGHNNGRLKIWKELQNPSDYTPFFINLSRVRREGPVECMEDIIKESII